MIAPYLRPENSAGPMLQKLTAAEYKVAYFASGVVVFTKMKDAAMQKVMDWRFMEDGQPLWVRPVVIPKDGSSPNSARLMIDFIVSHDGQAAFGRCGLTPPGRMFAGRVARASHERDCRAVGASRTVIAASTRVAEAGGRISRPLEADDAEKK